MLFYYFQSLLFQEVGFNRLHFADLFADTHNKSMQLLIFHMCSLVSKLCFLPMKFILSTFKSFIHAFCVVFLASSKNKTIGLFQPFLALFCH